MKKILIIVAVVGTLWYLGVAFSYDRERISGADFRRERFTEIVEIKQMDGVWRPVNPSIKSLHQMRQLRERNEQQSDIESAVEAALDRR